MPSNDTGGKTLTVTGGNNQLVVVYANEDGAGAAPPLAGAGSLNNTNPDFDFSALNSNQVYTVAPGDAADLTIDGGNKQIIVQYLLPEGAASTGGDTVDIQGGNNQFVVAYDTAQASDAAGNTVTVDGGNNKYVVAYPTDGSGGGMPVANPFAPNSGPSGAGNDSGVTAGAAGNNSVTVNGDHNQYAIQYPSASGTGSATGGASPGGVGMSGSQSAGMTGGTATGGAPSTADLTALLQMSPFGRILDIPGVDASTLLAGFASATAGNGGGENPFAGIAPGTNPFSGNGGGFGMPGQPAPASDPNYTYDFGGGTTPAAGSGMGMGMPTTGTGTGGSTGGSTPAPTTTAPSADDLSALLKMSPFGVLLDIPGVTTDSLLSAFASAAGGNPFGGSKAGSAPSTTPTPPPTGSEIGADVASAAKAAAQSFLSSLPASSPAAGAIDAFLNGKDVGATILAGIQAETGTTPSIPAIFLT